MDASAAPSDGRPLHAIYDATFNAADDLGRLRAETVDALARNGRDDAHRRVVILVVSELATNALKHAQPPYHLTIEVDDDETFVEVTDGTVDPAATRAPAFDAGGYGLNLVTTLAAAWGTNVTPDQRGKTVWAALDRACAF